MSKQNDFIKAPVFGISEDELATGSVNDNEVGTINGKKIKAHSITSDQIAAGAVGAVQLQAGAITAFKITVPNRVKGTTVVFSVGGANNDTLQWTDGVAYLMKMKYTPGDTMGDLQVVQVQQTISSGSYQFKAGDSAYYFYVEWAKDQDSDEPADSATLTMKKATTYPSSDTAIVLAYAWYDSILGLAQFQALDTAGGGVRISGNSIIAGSITAQNIRAGTITADRLSFPAFNKSTDTLDSISDGVTYKRVSATQIATFTDGSNRAIAYIGSDGKYQTVLQSTSYVIPSQSGLYLTAQHLGFYNATLGGWSVDIRNTGEMFLGSQYNNQYLYWDGNTLTVKGNIEANSVTANISITSPYITLSGSGYIAGGKSSFTDTNNGFWLGYYYGNYVFSIGNSSQYLKWDGATLTVSGNIASSTITSSTITGSTLETNASGERIEISTYNYIYFYESNNYLTSMIYAPTGVGLNILSYRAISLFSTGTLTIQSDQGNINLIPGSGHYITIQGSMYISAGYSIQFYSPSGMGGRFWYSNGNLYFTDENGNQHTISYT